MKAQPIISDALRLIGQVHPGQTPADAELAEGLLVLNALLDSWSIERLNIIVVGSALYDLVTATGAYTIGPGGTFNQARPIKIERANIKVVDGGAATHWLRLGPLGLLTAKEWAAIIEPGATATVPEALYYDHAFPLGNINLWPVPVFTGTAPKIELFYWNALTAFPDLNTTDVSLAPGYDAALKYNLALVLAPRHGVAPPQAVVAAAAETKAAIRALNVALPDAEPPAGPLNAVPPTQGAS